MNKKILSIVILGLTLLTSQVKAQASLTVDAPKVVALNEPFRIVYTSIGHSENFISPDLSAFDILAGPSISTMNRSSNINGNKTESFEMNYTFIVRAKGVGKFKIEPASVNIGNKKYSSPRVEIEVVEAEQSDPQGNQAGQSALQTGEISDEDLFLRLTVNKSRVVEGEPIIATLKLYTRVDISGFQDVKFPSFAGFWSQEINPDQQVNFQRESYNGKIYNSAVLRDFMLIPQQTGAVSIEPAEIVCAVQIRRRSTSSYRSIFDDFFDPGYSTIRKRLTTPKMSVEVSALPTPAPSSFSGGVGRYKIEAKLSRDSLNAHEASALIVTVSGEGNLNLIEAPKINFPADFESYDVKRSESIASGSGGTKGSKTYEYPFIPRSYGDFTLGPVEFTYYDISQRKYVTLNSGPLMVSVARGEDGAGMSQSGAPVSIGRQSVQSLGEDIRYISTSMKGLKRQGSLFAGSLTFGIVLTVIVLLYFVTSFILSKFIKSRADVAGTRNRRARKVAKARLKNAKMLFKKNLYSAFYEELYKAVTGYLSDKLILPVSDMTRDNLRERLTERGVSEDIFNRLNTLLDDCEFARYAPSEGYYAMENHYQESINIISAIEK